MQSSYYKKNDNDKVWWKDIPEDIGTFIFSFDRKKDFNLFQDYPHALTREQKEIFDKENQFWVDFFKD